MSLYSNDSYSQRQPRTSTSKATSYISKTTGNTTSQYGRTHRSLPGTESSRNEFNKRQLVAMKKATDKHESPPKEKHVRFLLLGCACTKDALTFFDCSKHLPLSSQAITAWKFYYLVHRLIRESSNAVQKVNSKSGKIVSMTRTASVSESSSTGIVDTKKISPILDDCFKYHNHMKQIGQMWKGQIHIAYANLVGQYSELIDKRLTFHKKFKDEMPNGALDFSDKHLNDDIQYLFEVSADVCDQLEMNLNLSDTIMQTIKGYDTSETTQAGFCRMHPCTLIILDCSHLYDFLVKILFKMHNQLPADVLEGHRSRFKVNHNKLRSFYETCNNITYIRERISLPEIPKEAPDFLATAEFKDLEIKELSKNTAETKIDEIDDNISMISVDDLLGLSNTPSEVSSVSDMGTFSMQNAPVNQPMQQNNQMNELVPNLLEEIEHLKSKIAIMEKDQHTEITTLFGALSQAKNVLQQKDLEIDELKTKVNEAESTKVNVAATSKQALGAQQLYTTIKSKYMTLCNEHAKQLSNNQE